MVRRMKQVTGLLAFCLAAGMAPAASAGSSEPPQTVGGHILGLQAICDPCRPEKFSAGFGDMLEGPVFDRQGNLWVTGITKGNLWRIAPDGSHSVALQFPPDIRFPAGLRFAADGTLYGVAMSGGLFSVDLTTKKVSLIANGPTLGGLPDGAFHGLDDVFIDHAGGMYLTDAAGSGALRPVGQIFYRDAAGDFHRIVPDGLAFPNGVVLSPDEKMLYVSEWSRNQIIAVPVVAPGVINVGWSYVFARLNGGHGPDSITADSQGNVYAAHAGEGEIAIFAPDGDYYGAIQLPPEAGRDVTNVAIHAGYLYVTESQKGEVWRVKVKIPGIALYGGA